MPNIYNAYRGRSRRTGLIDDRAWKTWLPSSVAGLVLWLEADQITGLNDGDNIATWPDISGMGYNATQANDAIRPSYETNELNGLPVARFASGDGMATTCNLANPYSVAIVYKTTDSAGCRRAAAGSNNWLIGPYSGYHQVYNNAFINLGAATNNVWVYITVVGTSGGAFARINGGGQVSNTRNGTPGYLNFATSGAYGEPFIGDIYAMIAYNTNISTDDMLELEAYLRRKCALA